MDGVVKTVKFIFTDKILLIIIQQVHFMPQKQVNTGKGNIQIIKTLREYTNNLGYN